MKNLPDVLDVSQVKLILKDLTSKISMKFASKAELKEQVDALTAEINSLKQVNEDFEARISALENPNSEEPADGQ